MLGRWWALDLPCALAPNSRSCILARRPKSVCLIPPSLVPFISSSLIDVGRKQAAREQPGGA